jgi:hypothetical protein
MKYVPAVLLCASVLVPAHARATQQFAKETMLACSSCHTATMRLTPLGRGFRNSNLRMVRLTKDGGPAVALRGQFAYSGEPDPTGLPKAIVDEIDDFLAGQIADNWTYFAEVYNVDGGRPGAAREAWVEYASAHQRLPQSFRITAGLLPLPTPVDPESFRELNQHYEVWDQTVGGNSFTFFDPHKAVMLSRGSQIRGTSASIAAVQGSVALDGMLAVKHVAGPLVLDAYRYDGHRPTGPIRDAFTRTGFGASLYAGRFQASAFTQSGYDSSSNGNGLALASGGVFSKRAISSRRRFSQLRDTKAPRTQQARSIARLPWDWVPASEIHFA